MKLLAAVMTLALASFSFQASAFGNRFDDSQQASPDKKPPKPNTDTPPESKAGDKKDATKKSKAEAPEKKEKAKEKK